MTPLAHAGHWAAQLLYLAAGRWRWSGAIVWAKIRGRGVDERATSTKSRSDRSE